MKTTQYTPSSNYILIKEHEVKSKGKIILPHNKKNEDRQFEVIRIGKEVSTAKVGDIIILGDVQLIDLRFEDYPKSILYQTQEFGILGFYNETVQ